MEDDAQFRVLFEAAMKAVSKPAPGNLPRAVRDLVAEGGNVLASDDAPVIKRDVKAVIRRMRLNESGKWVARVRKS